MRRVVLRSAAFFAAPLFLLAGIGWSAEPARFKRVVFGGSTQDLADFERLATRAKRSGATHINISMGLPRSLWQYDSPGDPYPAWVVTNPGLLKTAIPEKLRSYLPHDHAEKVLGMLEARGRVLRRLGLKAAMNTFEPQMLPEAVFAAHPLWRGARVDHPARSRVARFAPTVDNPEVLALYRESVAALLRRCPEIEMLSLLTNDSGSGLDWSGGLYSGRFGNTFYQHRPMEARLHDFFAALQQGARDAGGSLEIDIGMTREQDPARIAAKLAPGMSIENLEGPGATPYKAGAGQGQSFYPVRSIPDPASFLERLEQAAKSPAPRLAVSIGDEVNRDLYFEIYDRFRKNPTQDAAERLALLKQIAVARGGPAKGPDWLALWLSLHEAQKFIRLVDSGGTIFDLGCVQQRWLTRPFVPFPGELKPAEKEYYRKFQFQARTEEDADNLTDLQASDTYRGWSGQYLVRGIVRQMEAHIANAQKLAESLDAPLAKRLAVLMCVLRTSRNAVSYQAQLDRVRRLGVPPDPQPVILTQSSWDRQMILETARAEIDNTALLIDLLDSNPAAILHMAGSREEEDIRLLGPDLIEHLKRKLEIMNAHWLDYNRLFTTPNL